MTETSAKQRMGRWLGAGFSVAVLAINVFTINCGLGQPTDIGIRATNGRTDGKTPSTASTERSLIALLPNHALSFVTASGSRCASFPKTASGLSIPCAVSDKPLDGAVSAAVAGTCTISVGGGDDDDDGTPSYGLACQTTIGGPCIANDTGRNVASLVTSTDFAAVIAEHPAGDGLDGYVVEDARNPALTMTFHGDDSYCEDAFKLGDD